MKIKMLKDAAGYDDGIHEKHYQAGEAYEVSEGLAKCFFDLKVAEEIDANEKAKEPHDDKALDEYENKAEKPKAKKKEAN